MRVLEHTFGDENRFLLRHPNGSIMTRSRPDSELRKRTLG